MRNYRDGFFPFLGGQIKEEFEALKREFRPDLVFTHHRDDRHQDHRLISDLTWNTFRNHLILEYEIPKYDGDMAAPNFFVPLEKSACSAGRSKSSSTASSRKTRNSGSTKRPSLRSSGSAGWKPTHPHDLPRPSIAERPSWVIRLPEPADPEARGQPDPPAQVHRLQSLPISPGWTWW